MTEIYRAEVIGSLVRPAYLNEGRDAMRAGKLSMEDFKKLEDKAVDEALALQERAGMDVVTDGEMRRMIYIVPGSGTMSPAQGPSLNRTLRWRRRDGEATLEQRAQVPVFPITEKLKFTHSVLADEYSYAAKKTSKPLKVTMPAPTSVINRWAPEYSSGAYPTPDALLVDAVDMLKDEVRALAAAGCRYVQIDAPELTGTSGDTGQEERPGFKPNYSEWMRNAGVASLNAVATVPGVHFALHVCRGNFRGFWLSEAPWEAIARHIFPRTTNFSTFLMEYDDWRAGSFAPLADLGRDKIAVLGLISTKRVELEPADEIAKRIEEASRYFPREQLALSSQCGFSPDAHSNVCSQEQQEAKLRLIAEIAHRVWP